MTKPATAASSSLRARNDPEQTFQNICRTCMSKNRETLRSIFDQLYKSLKICEMLNCTTPQLFIDSRDPLPKSICLACLEKLNIAYQFQEMCISSDNYMRNMLDSGVLEQKNVLQTKASTSKAAIFLDEVPLQTEDLNLAGRMKVEITEEDLTTPATSKQNNNMEQDPLLTQEFSRLQECIKIEMNEEEINDFDLVKSLDSQTKMNESAESLAQQEEDINETTVVWSSGSNKSDSSVDEGEIPSKKKRRHNISWMFVKQFENCNEAEEALKLDTIWSFNYSHRTEEGLKKFYRCNKAKKRGPQCSAKVYLLFDSTSDAVFMYRAEAYHDHDNLPPRVSTPGLSEVVKLEINKLFNLKMKPKAIMNNLAKLKGIAMPSMSQLKNYLCDQRRAKYNFQTVSLAELEQWLLINSAIPVSPHEMFVISYEVIESETPVFRFVISTKHLLELTRDVKVIHAGATTNKLMWQGFPVKVIGTTDKDRKFHALCLAVITKEQKDDFKMIFDALKNKVTALFSSDLRPNVLVFNATKEIQDAFTESFGTDVIVRICWTYAKRKMENLIGSLIKIPQKGVLADLEVLHAITCPDLFNAASTAFLQKYHYQQEFVDYFKEHWLLQNRNWYLGATPYPTPTSNALETFNKAIKNSNTLQERLPLNRFFIAVAEIVSQWSTKYILYPEHNAFVKFPTITLKDWTTSYQWSKLTKEVVELRKDENYRYYQLPAGVSFVCEKFEKQWENFDEFKAQYFSKWQISLPINTEEWKFGKCDCPAFYKMYICKHIIGLAIRLKHAVPPFGVKSVFMGEKRKRGRPSKFKQALITQ